MTIRKRYTTGLRQRRREQRVRIRAHMKSVKAVRRAVFVRGWGQAVLTGKSQTNSKGVLHHQVRGDFGRECVLWVTMDRIQDRIMEA